jgi:hypothetical protein
LVGLSFFERLERFAELEPFDFVFEVTSKIIPLQTQRYFWNIDIRISLKFSSTQIEYIEPGALRVTKPFSILVSLNSLNQRSKVESPSSERRSADTEFQSVLS